MKDKEPYILYVDDEVHNLNAFQAAFRNAFRIATADNAGDAVAFIQHNPVAVILADQRMPQSSGVDLLEWVAKYSPSTSRILITGYFDKEPLLQAVNKGKIFHYVLKPWDEASLAIQLQRGLERYKSKELLNQKSQMVEKVISELERFIYSTSHDIRAPLMSVLGLTEIMRLEMGQHTYIDLMEQSIKRLDMFLLNILDHYKSVRSEPLSGIIDLEKMVADILESIKIYDTGKQVSIDVDINNSAPLRTDVFRIQLILSNLLSNAYKFHDVLQEDKHVYLRIDVNEDEACIIVEDNGQGIPEQFKDRLFQMFYRLDSGKSGSGLGLYLVKGAVDKLGGNISLESQQDAFTRVTVRIPNNLYQTTTQLAELV